MNEMSTLQVIESIFTIIGIILIPLVILIVGEMFRRQRETSDSAQRDTDRVALLLRSLGSDSSRERLLAMHVIKHLRDTDRFPEDLLSPITFTAFSDRPDIAAAAQMVLGDDIKEIPATVVLTELLAPLKVNFERSEQSFRRWHKLDIFEEEIIHNSNLFARDILLSKAHMIPTELLLEASLLVDHYNAWLEEYDRVRPNGIRDPKEPFVFVGVPPINKPFPRKESLKFIARFNELAQEEASAVAEKS